MRVLEYIHSSLIMMIIVPLLYTLAQYQDTDGTIILYIKCMLIIIPVVVTEIAVRKIRNPFLYILAGFLTTAALYGFINLFFSESSQCYRLVLPAESLIIVFVRFQERIRLARQAKEDDIYTAPQISFLNKPSFSFIWYFVIMYVVGICFSSKMLCDIAFINTALYFFTALAHTYLTATGDYLNLNKRTKSMPKKRIYAVNAVMTGAFAALVLMVVLAAFAFSGARRYTDVRSWFNDVPAEPFFAEYNTQPDAEENEADPFAMFDMGEPAPEPSKFWEYFWNVSAAAMLMFTAYGIFKMIRQVFAEFRGSFDDNGDRVEELKDEITDKEQLLDIRRYFRSDSASERVRRRYRKMIRKNRNEIPAPYETPTELEKNAGLLEDAVMKELHKEYELVRYGRQKG